MAEVKRAFLEVYLGAAEQALEALAGGPLNGAQRGALRALAEARYRDQAALVLNPHKNVRVSTTLGEIAAWAPVRANPADKSIPSPAVWTGHGTMFKPQAEADSVMGKMLQKLLDERKIAKDKMLALLVENGGDKKDPRYKTLDQEQKIWKLLANSYFGAQGERGFHFFDPAMGPAITYTGRVAIAGTIWGFEAFLAGNMWIGSADELARHVAACLRKSGGLPEVPGQAWGSPDFDGAPTAEECAAKLASHCAPGWDPGPAAAALARAVGPRARWSLMYRGDPYLFLSLPRCQDLLAEALGGTIREPDAESMERQHPEGKKALDLLWEGLEAWVAPPWLPSDGPKRVAVMRRKCVPVADTDSSFVCLGPWVDFLEGLFDFSEATDDQRLTALNCMIYILCVLSREQMGDLTRNLGVQADRRKRLVFKNEFVFKRVVITNGKKHYVGLQTHKEGKAIAGGGEMEFKGLSMKKSVVPKSTSKYLEHSVEQRLFRSDSLDRVGILMDVVGLDAKVRDSIEAGSAEFATPAVFGNVNAYKNPWSMPVVRGVAAWNAACPNNPIRQADRVNSFRVRVGSDAAELTAQMNSWPEGSEDRAALARVIAKFFGEGAPPELSGAGFNWICFPKSVSAMPAWLRPLVNVEDAARANVSPALPVLEAIGERPLTNPDPEVYSSTIAF